MVRRTAEAFKPLADAGKLGGYLLQLTPAFDPRENELDELAPVIEGLSPVPVAVEFRRRSWASSKRFEKVLDWLSAHDAVFVSVDTPPGDHVPIFPPIDAVTDDALAYMRCHGRNAEGYLHGRSVAEHFDYDYSKEELEEIAGRARDLDSEAAAGPRDVQQQRPGARAEGRPRAADDSRTGPGTGALGGAEGRKKDRRGDPRGMKAASPGWPTCWTPFTVCSWPGIRMQAKPYAGTYRRSSGPIRRPSPY